MDDNAKIQASAANNLTKAETEAIIGRKMTSQEC